MKICKKCKWIDKLYIDGKWYCYIHGCEAYPLASACSDFDERKSND